MNLKPMCHLLHSQNSLFLYFTISTNFFSTSLNYMDNSDVLGLELLISTSHRCLDTSATDPIHLTGYPR